MPRLFISQPLVDQWMSLGHAHLDGDLLRMTVSGMTLALYLHPAVSFERVDGDMADPYDLLGRVKTAAELAQIGAEHFDTSVVIQEIAYTVRPGFLAVMIAADGTELRVDAAGWARLSEVLGQLAAA